MRHLRSYHGLHSISLSSHAVLIGVLGFLLIAFQAPRNAQGTEPLKLKLAPEKIELAYLEASQIVLPQQLKSENTLGAQIDAQTIEWSISHKDVAVIQLEGNLVRIIAKGKGNATLTARWKQENSDEATATADIVCHDASHPVVLEFDNHIQPILARNGCNMGACHGALAGKGGFRLSLRGYDSATDHFNITRQDRGRRIDRQSTDASLILAKPSGAMEHKGGLRIPADSNDYKLLHRWIREGAKGPLASDSRLNRIEMVPSSVELSKGNMQQFAVIAHYSDGRMEDVTHWAKFTSTDESVATVTDSGLAKIMGPGEGAVSVWFSSTIAASRIRVPFHSSEIASITAADSDIQVPWIDAPVSSQLKTLGLVSSDRSTDSEFLRRSSLDATGSIPTENEILAFLADASPDKRNRWIDSLLDSPEFVDYWAYRWSDLLTLNSNLLPPEGTKAYYQWIRRHVSINTPWDQFAREIVTARGGASENGATNFYAINQDPENMTESVCQAFMGLSIGCAKCHNHPLEKWTNDQYYAMANLFARVRAKGWGGDPRSGDGARTLVVLDRGDLIQPLRGKPQPPTPLDGTPLELDDPRDRRQALAQWLTSPENPYFTRAIVNRVWAAYFGIGIVNPVDDMRSSNPASNPILMDNLCRELVDNKYDLKHLMKSIMRSSTYQRSSQTTAENAADRKYFSHYYPRRLMAEVIHDAIVDVTAVPTLFDKIGFLGGDKRAVNFYSKGTKAIQLFDSNVESEFLKTFGRNQRRITCECERSDEPSVIQALHLSNGDTLNRKLAEKGGVADQLLETYPENNKAIVESLYLRCLSRSPSEDERHALTQVLDNTSKDEIRSAVEDLVWSLVTSREFLFNH